MPTTDFTTLKTKTLKLLADASEFAKSIDASSAVRLGETADRLAAERLHMVVCGEFKRGKSSLVNALLNEQELCPVGIDLTTAIVTTIAYGETERLTVILGRPGEASHTETITRAEIPNYVSEVHNPSNRRGVRLLAIETPNPMLASGLVVVDTPGVGGLVAAHSDVTYAFLPNADVVLFVGDVQSPLTVKELEFAGLTSKFCRHFIHVVTKLDGDAGAEADGVIATNRQKLAKVLNRPEMEIPVIGLSSKAKQAYCESLDRQDLEDSNFPKLEAEVWKLLGEHRGAVLLEGSLGRAAQILGEMRAPMIAGLEALEASSKQEVDELQTRWQALSNRITELQSNQAVWRTMLGDRLDDLSADTRHDLTVAFSELRTEADMAMNLEEFLQEPTRLIDRLQVDVNALCGRLTDAVRDGASIILSELAASTRLQLSEVNIGSIKLTKIDGIYTDSVEKTSWWTKALQMTSRAGIMSTAGATLATLFGGAVGGALGFLAGGAGAIPGAILGSQLGAVIGGVGGLATGAKSALTQINQQDQANARRQIQPIIIRFLNDSERDVGRELANSIKSLKRALRDDLAEQIDTDRKVCEETLSAIVKSRKMVPAEAKQQVAKIRNKLATVDGLISRSAELLQTISSSSEAQTADEQTQGPVLVGSSSNSFGGWADD